MFSIRKQGFSGGSDGKESACNVGDLGSIHGLSRSPEEGNGNSLQYTCLENSMDRGDCRPAPPLYLPWQAPLGAADCTANPGPGGGPMEA